MHRFFEPSLCRYSSSASGLNLDTNSETGADRGWMPTTWMNGARCFCNGSTAFISSCTSIRAVSNSTLRTWSVKFSSALQFSTATITRCSMYVLQMKLVHHAYSCLFGTFLCNSESERHVNRSKQRSFSIWSFFKSFHIRFRNYLYVYKDRVSSLGMETSLSL